MTYLLFVVILMQFGYQIYSDLQNRKERDILTQKLMAKDLIDYKVASEKTEDGVSEVDENEYQSLEEAGVDGVLKAK